MIVHAASELNGEGIVVGTDAAEDFRHRAEIGIRPSGG
jgi:hypothetical protein